MRGTSHVVFGLAGAIVIASIPPYIAGPSLFSEVPTIDHVAEKVIFYGLAALGALAPDIDNASSTLGKRLGPISRGVQHLTGHRTFFHSLLGMAIIGSAIWALQYTVGLALYKAGLTSTGEALAYGIHPGAFFLAPGVGIAFAGFLTGYFLHLVADSLTREGVPWLWPYHAYYGFPPSRDLRFRTGSGWEPAVVIAIGVIVLVAFVFGWLSV
jgi:inner membrane protein